jgi:hypothetical protein
MSFKIPRSVRIVVNVIAYTLITLVAITNVFKGNYDLAFWQVMTLVFMVLCDVASVIQDKQSKLIDTVVGDLKEAADTLRLCGELIKKQNTMIEGLKSKKGKK